MKPGINCVRNIDEWFGIEAPEEGYDGLAEPNYYLEEPEEQAERLTALIYRATDGNVAVDWRFERMSSVGPVYRLSLDGRSTPIKTRTSKPSFHKEVSDLVAELNGWARGELVWYKMGHASQLRFGYKHVTQCFDNMSFEDAVVAAVRFAKTKWVGCC